MESYYIWIIAGVALLVGEIFTLDFSLTCFGLAAFGAAIAAFFGATFTVQVMVFSLTALVLFFTIRKYLAKLIHKSTAQANSNASALVGREGKVIQKVDSKAGTGRVKIDGDEWKAVADAVIAEGTDVKVVSVDSATIKVEKK